MSAKAGQTSPMCGETAWFCPAAILVIHMEPRGPLQAHTGTVTKQMTLAELAPAPGGTQTPAQARTVQTSSGNGAREAAVAVTDGHQERVIHRWLDEGSCEAFLLLPVAVGFPVGFAHMGWGTQGLAQVTVSCESLPLKLSWTLSSPHGGQLRGLNAIGSGGCRISFLFIPRTKKGDTNKKDKKTLCS